MPTGYGYVLIFLLVGLAFLGATLLAARMFRPSKPSAVKGEAYECGPRAIGEGWHQFNIRYYLFAILFVLFAVETAYLYPWAIRYKFWGLFAVVEMVIFLGILTLGLVYAWRKGALEWEE